MNALTHIDHEGNLTMVDVGGKPVQCRIARATGRISLAPQTMDLIQKTLIKKGDVIAAARIAGIQAAKQTAHLIPLCHPLITDAIFVTPAIQKDGIEIEAEVRCTGRTGAEMEALTAVSIALLTIYDMCKAVDHTMVIGSVRLVHKEKLG